MIGNYKKRIFFVLSFITTVIGFQGCSNIIDNTNAYSEPSNTAGIEKSLSNKKEKSEDEKIQDIIKENKDSIATLVNKTNSLEKEYKPQDLVIPNVNLACAKAAEQSQMRELAASALERMFEDAKNDGIELYLVSGFRSSEYQKKLFDNSLIGKGREYTEQYIAKPDHSEHQTGLVADISSRSAGLLLESTFKDTEEGKWLEKNAHKYGFILRYKEGREADTGYSFEPWHFRYVGTELSNYIYKNNLILEDLYNNMKN